MLLCLGRPALQVCQLSFEIEGARGGEKTGKKGDKEGEGRGTGEGRRRREMEDDGSQDFNIKMGYVFNNRIQPQISSSLPLSPGASLSLCVFTRMG